ncbi:SRPBCC family protein [Candidatus Woesearchaeota archaeon]|nr:SRPBCC family protein [Candidatus Woesearchaeota archaeon]
MKTNSTFKSRQISISIKQHAEKIYEFASNPENLPKWAGGLSSSIRKIGNSLIAESPMGRIKIEFAAKNKYGVLDHNVTLPSGEIVYNPMRVFPNNGGSELAFTLYKRHGVSEKAFEDDAKIVKRDLKKLKSLIEKNKQG